jgi:hypothetical protein
MYTIPKSKLENCKDNYEILYLFPDEQSKTQNKLQINKITDLFVEINSTFQNDSYLFEGYLYKQKENEEYTYLITDILAKNENVISCDFALRQTLINELICKKTYNNHLTIGIHPIFHSSVEDIVQIFLNNFVFNEDITCIEHVYDKNFEKRRFIEESRVFQDCKKKIEKGKYADVYNVYDIDSGNSQGILYIKGIKESKMMKELFKDNVKEIILNCSYNKHFKKWQPNKN